ncbi:MAG: FAD-dependent oxidoreductase [Myxococcota bacterium]
MDPVGARERAFEALGKDIFDVLVIGGGVTGCAVARDAALRGFKVALVEKTDFAAGTSSKSTKLIHGGLRYLEHAQFKLVFEGTNERALLLRLAPHLVKPLPFLVPAYRESRPGLFKLDVGLWIYDALSKFSSPKLHRAFRAPKLVALEPSLRTEELKGGIIYYDCITDDARLTLENALDARALGAVVLNHVRAKNLTRDATGRVDGALVADAEPGHPREVTVKAKVVVNASGPWSDEVRALLGESPILKPTKGVHLVVDAARLPLRHAVLMLARRDRRVMFAIPWGERSVLGTTDTFYDGSLDRVVATRDDVDYILETANHYFPQARLAHVDVLATWAGLRPLVKPQGGAVDASDVSREQQLIDQPGFVTIAGGKLTTFRRIAAEVVDAVGAQLGKRVPSTTAERSLPGAVGIAGEEELADIAELAREKGLSEKSARHLADAYGVRAPEVAARVAADLTAGALLAPDLPYLMAEVDEAVEKEQALTLTDVLGRRVPLLLRGRDQGLSVAPAVADRIARTLGWSPARATEEIERYRETVEDSRRFRA